MNSENKTQTNIDCTDVACNISDIIPAIYTSETEQAIFLMGYLGCGLEYLIHSIQLEKEAITAQFAAKNGKEYNIWKHGYYTAQTKLRLTIMNSALNSSTPALEKMLQYFKTTDDEINNIEYE